MSWKILYVDDEDDIREIAVMALELEPLFEVRDCNSGADALAMTADWKPDLVLLDVMMPGMDGPTTFQQLRDRDGEEAPLVLFCTARTQDRDVEAFLALGARAVLAKPFDPLTLASIVKSHLE